MMAGVLRSASAARHRGHATLIRAPVAVRRRVDLFEPQRRARRA